MFAKNTNNQEENTNLNQNNDDIIMKENNFQFQQPLNSLISNNNLLNKEVNTNDFIIKNQPISNIINSYENQNTQNIESFSPMPKPDFSIIEKKESNFQYKERGSYKKPKNIIPESPMKSPCQKFFTPVKLQSNLFGNSSTFRKLNFNEVEENINEENLNLQDNIDNIEENDYDYSDLRVENLDLESPKNLKNEQKQRKNKSNNDFKLKKNNQSTKINTFNDRFNNYRKTSVNENNLNGIDNDERRRGINTFLSNTNKGEKINFLDFIKCKKTASGKNLNFNNINNVNNINNMENLNKDNKDMMNVNKPLLFGNNNNFNNNNFLNNMNVKNMNSGFNFNLGSNNSGNCNMNFLGNKLIDKDVVYSGNSFNNIFGGNCNNNMLIEKTTEPNQGIYILL